MIVAILVLAFLNSALAWWMVRQYHLDKQTEGIRLTILAESAMSHIKAGSLEEKVRIESLKKSYDLNLERLKDALNKGDKLENPKEKAPQVFRTITGQEINSQEYEIV